MQITIAKIWINSIPIQKIRIAEARHYLMASAILGFNSVKFLNNLMSLNTSLNLNLGSSEILFK